MFITLTVIMNGNEELIDVAISHIQFLSPVIEGNDKYQLKTNIELGNHYIGVKETREQIFKKIENSRLAKG